MQILLGDFNAKVGRDNIFNQTIGNESLHEEINDNGVGIVKFATSKKIYFFYSTKCLNRIILIKPGPLLMGRLTIRLIIY